MVEHEGEFYDRQEVREPELRHDQMFTALPGLVRHAIDNAPGMAQRLAGIDAAAVTSPEALAALPLLRKADLVAQQAKHPPFGEFAATPVGRLARVFASSGPVVEPESVRTDYWRFARALFAAGLRAGDLIHNAFSYHLNPAGMMVEGGARAIGCPVIPAGEAEAARQVDVVQRLRPKAFTGKPAALAHLLMAAEANRCELPSLARAVLSGEPLSRERRLHFEAAGIATFDCYATPDIGLIAYETSAHDGLVIDEAVILEIIDPSTGQPVGAGAVGEVVVTSFNPDYPLIRLATGDLSAFLPGVSACGRTNRRLVGWLGRLEHAATVGGHLLHPGQIAAIMQRHHLQRGRLVVDRVQARDRLRFLVETGTHEAGLAAALGASVHEVTGLNGQVELVAPGTLPNDGKVIDDRRA
ncbi:MAG: phenylacetate--CoA ligase family protein [Geminicoccaceae bacterium]|nr:MAG: phenylacetate--CoA ligase family protein [Geminicoccaceae bacterium]